MKWLFYDLLFFLAYLALLPGFLLKMKRRGGYAARFADRFGRYPRELVFPEGAVWIHAVSVGEVYVAGRFMGELRRQSPEIRFVLSTTSSTGWAEALKQLGPGDVRIYCPLDFALCVRRALDRIRPKALILTESEIWPNLLRAAAKRGIPLWLVNARISDRSAPRYSKLRYWFGDIFNLFTKILTQSEQDKQRLVAAGANPSIIEVTGSVKYDVAARAPEKETSVRNWIHHALGGEHPILLGGSTWPGEDTVLLRIYSKLRAACPDWRLIIAPRHFEKADAIQANIRAAGFTCIRKSKSPNAIDPDAVLLADTTGELIGFYANADIAFVGKSLCAHGAQNMIEPCLCGCATLVGPYTENFRPVMRDILAAHAIIQVPDAQTLEQQILRLAKDTPARQALGQKAAHLVHSRKGVAEHCAKQILATLRT